MDSAARYLSLRDWHAHLDGRLSLGLPMERIYLLDVLALHICSITLGALIRRLKSHLRFGSKAIAVVLGENWRKKETTKP